MTEGEYDLKEAIFLYVIDYEMSNGTDVDGKKLEFKIDRQQSELKINISFEEINKESQ